MATFDDLIGSSEFLAAAPEDKLRMANAHWDSVAAQAPDEDSLNSVELHRRLSIGGLEAIGRSRGEIGDGTFKSLYANEAQAYNNAWSALRSGNTDEETFGRNMSAVRDAVRDTGLAQQAEVDNFNQRITRTTQLSDALRQSLTQGDPALEANFATAVTLDPSKGGLRRNAQGQWEMPIGQAIAQDPDVLPSSASLLDKTGEFLSLIPGAVLSPLMSMGTSAANALGAHDTRNSATIEAYKQANNLSDEDVISIYNNIGNENREWQGSENFRIMASGRLKANPGASGLLDKDATTKAVLESSAPDIAKKEFLNNIDSLREATADKLATDLAVFSQNHSVQTDDFSGYFINQKKANPNLTTADIVSSYVKKEKFSTGGALWSEFTTEGVAKLGQTVAGVGGAFGIKPLGDWAANSARDNQKMAAAAGALFGDQTMWDSVVKEAPSIAATILLTRGAGLAAGGTARLLTPLAETATAAEIAAAGATRLTAANAAGMVAGVGSSALQSAGVTYAENLMTNLDSGMNREQAHEKAQGKALIAGITTGMITGAFSMGGAGGIESAGLARMTVGDMAEEAAKRGIPYTTAVRNGISSMVNGLASKSKIAGLAAKGIAMPVNFGLRVAGSTLGKGILAEGAEEGIDQMVGKFMQADPGTPVFNAFSEAWAAAQVGAVFGGFSGAIEAKAESKKKSNEAARSAAMAAESAAAAKGGAAVMSEEEISAAAAAEKGVTASPTDQRKPGEITEIWKDKDGKLTGLRYDTNGVSFVRESSEGEWVDEAGPKTNIGAARRRMVAEGLAPAAARNAEGEAIHYTDESAAREVAQIRADTEGRLAEAAEASRVRALSPAARQAEIDLKTQSEGRDADVLLKRQAEEAARAERDDRAKAREIPVAVGEIAEEWVDSDRRPVAIRKDEGGVTIVRKNDKGEWTPEGGRTNLFAARRRLAKDGAEPVRAVGIDGTTTELTGQQVSGYLNDVRAGRVRVGQRIAARSQRQIKSASEAQAAADKAGGEARAEAKSKRQATVAALKAQADTEFSNSTLVGVDVPIVPEDYEEGSDLRKSAEVLTANGIDTVKKAFEWIRDPRFLNLATDQFGPKKWSEALDAINDVIRAKEAGVLVDSSGVQQAARPEAPPATPDVGTPPAATPEATPESPAPPPEAEGPPPAVTEEQPPIIPPDETPPANEQPATPAQEAIPEAEAPPRTEPTPSPQGVGEGVGPSPAIAGILGTIPAVTVVGNAEATTTNTSEEALQQEVRTDADTAIVVLTDPVVVDAPSLTNDQAGQLASDLAQASPEEVAAVRAEAAETAADPPPVDLSDTSRLDERGSARVPASKYGYGSQFPISLTAKAMNKLVSSLSKRFNLPIKWVDTLPDDVFGQYDPDTGTVYLNKNLIAKTSETPLHEVSHAFLAAIKAGNPALYSNLMAELNSLIDNSPKLQQVRNRIIDAYPSLNESQIMDELMATYLGVHGDGILGRRVDDSGAKEKSFADKAWKHITAMLKDMFKGRINVSSIRPNTTLEQLAGMITDPAAFYDIGGAHGPADVTTRTALQEFAFGMRHAANAALSSMNEAGMGVAWVIGIEGKPSLKMIFGGNGRADIHTMSSMAENLNRGIDAGRWTSLREKLKGWTDYKLGGGFWKGDEDLLAKIREETNDSPLNADNVAYLIDHVVMQKSEWAKADRSGDVDMNNVEASNHVLNAFHMMRTGKIRTDVTSVPDSYTNAFLAALGADSSIITGAVDRAGLYNQLTPEQLQAVRGALQARLRAADALAAAAASPNLSDESAVRILSDLTRDEHAALLQIGSLGLDLGLSDRVTFDDFANDRIPGELKGWVNRAARRAALAGIHQVSAMPASNIPRIPTATAIIGAANNIFNHIEKVAIAKMLGFTSWTSRTEDALSKRFADWIVDAKTSLGKLAGVMEKIGLYLRGVMAAAVVAISVTGATTQRVDTIPLTRIALDSGVEVNPDTVSLSSIAKAQSRAANVQAAAQARNEQRRAATPLTGVSDLIDKMSPATVEDAANPAPTGPAVDVGAVPEIQPTVGEVQPPLPNQISVALPQPALPTADFGGVSVTDDVEVMANWIVRNDDSSGKPFILADKMEGTVHFFDASGKLTRKAPALFGKTPGDVGPSDIGTKDIDFVRANPKYHVTPSGRFESETEKSTEYGETIDFDQRDKMTLAVHKVFLGRPKEKRQEALDTESGADNRKSLGCINLNDADSAFVNDMFREGGVLYINPETDEGVNSFGGFGVLRDTRSRRPRRLSRKPKKSTKAETTPVRIGDETRDGLYNKIDPGPAFASPTGAGRTMPTTDGTPQAGFNKVGEALSFRAKMAAREGLIATELKVVSTEKDGEIKYFVVVPDPFGNAEAKRVGDLLSTAIADPTHSHSLPTIKELKSYLESSGNNMIKAFRHITNKAKDIAFEQGWLVANNVDQAAAGENLSLAVQTNITQVAWAKSVASARMKTLRAKHGNPMGTDRNFGSPTYGLALDVKLKSPGQSRHMSDIMQRSMVDPNAYDLTPAQTAFVNDVRKILEGMRQQMRNAHLDKNYLKTGGHDLQKFIDDPTVGDNSWREYFPREVIGYLDANGNPQTKPYIGASSPNTVHKGFDESRMVDGEGKWLSLQQISEGTDQQKSVIYAADEFDILEGFISKSYSAIAASDLAQNLDQFIVNRGPDSKSSLRNAFIAGVPVLNDSIFSNEVAQFLDKHLVDNRKISQGLQSVLEASSLWKSLVLSFDLAGGLTVAGVGTMTAAFRTGGIFAALENLGGQVMDVARAAGTDPKAYHRLCAELSPYMLEMATLNGKIGSGQDWQEVQAQMVKDHEIKKTLAGKQSIVGAAKGAIGQFSKRLSDYHANVCEIGKVQMWRSVRERFLDENGNLRTDEQSINDMREEIRSIDRSFGYSNDQDISMQSKTSRAWMNILGTAPGMYISMINNVTTKHGIKHIGEYAGASVIYFVAAAVAAGMDEEEIKKRLNPINKGFLKVDVDMGSGGKLRIGFSQFYTALFVMAAKQADVFKRVAVDGETLTFSEYVAPIANFARNRISPSVSAAIGLMTDEDFMGNHISKGGTIFRSMTPTSLQEPLSIVIDNVIGSTVLASAQQHFNASENESMKHKATTFVANVLGMNAYTLDTRQQMSDVRDTIARDRYGVSFKDMADMGAASEIALQVNQQFKDIPKWTNQEHIAEIQARERARASKMIPSDVKNYLMRTGAMDQVRIGGIQLRDGSFMFTDGLIRDNHYRAAIQEAVDMPGGIREQMQFSEANDINPANKQKEALDTMNKAFKSDNANVAATLGILTK